MCIRDSGVTEAGTPTMGLLKSAIGIQQHSNTVSLFKKAEELGVDYVLAKDLQASNLESILCLLYTSRCV